MLGNLSYKLPADAPSGGGGGGITFSSGAVGDLMVRTAAATIGALAGTVGSIPYMQTASQFGFNIFFNWNSATGNHGVGVAVALERFHVGNGNARFDGRVQLTKGPDVASAADLGPTTGNYFTVTGNTNIDFIKTTNWIPGSEITLEFSGTPTLNHNTAAPPVGSAALFLAGSVNFLCVAECVFKFAWNGTVWKEVSRTIF